MRPKRFFLDLPSRGTLKADNLKAKDVYEPKYLKSRVNVKDRKQK